VSLFGPKEPCPNCGRKVKREEDPGVFLCPHCGKPGPWASPDQVSAWRTQTAARARYEELLTQLSTNSALPGGDGSELGAARKAATYTATELGQINLQAFRTVLTAAVADDLLTPAESAHLAGLLSVLGLTWDYVRQADPGLWQHAFVASINGGQLPEVASPHILQKKGEIVHYECEATLMKEVAVRQYQGGYQGFSIPIGKTGVRYRAGASRGHSVQVGTQLQVADTGVLSITNKRAVYAGTRKTVDMTYSKLVNLSVYADGVQFHLSNRVNAPLFRIPNGSDIVAVIVNVAAQRTG
jgi:hypothetical protein